MSDAPKKTIEQIATELALALRGWDPEARLLANVTAEEIARLTGVVLTNPPEHPIDFTVQVVSSDREVVEKWVERGAGRRVLSVEDRRIMLGIWTTPASVDLVFSADADSLDAAYHEAAEWVRSQPE